MCVGVAGWRATHTLYTSGKSDRLEPGCAANHSSASGHASWVRASLIRVFVIFMVFMIFSHLAASQVAGHGGAPVPARAPGQDLEYVRGCGRVAGHGGAHVLARVPRQGLEYVRGCGR